MTLFLTQPMRVRAQDGETPLPEVTAQEIISAINALRNANGYTTLKENPILMATAQSTAEIMAAGHMSGHIGDVRGRVMAAGYGSGVAAWATENFVIGPLPLEQIMLAWSDSEHMIPVSNPNYCDIGVGIAKQDEAVYYVLHAAYTDRHYCGSPDSGTQSPDTTASPAGISQVIYPVTIATPLADGRCYHIVQQGQTLWSIAVAYQTTIDDLVAYNNLYEDNATIYVGQRLYIPLSESSEVSGSINIQSEIPIQSEALLRTPQSTQTFSIEAHPTASPTLQVQSQSKREDFAYLIPLIAVGAASLLWMLGNILSPRK